MTAVTVAGSEADTIAPQGTMAPVVPLHEPPDLDLDLVRLPPVRSRFRTIAAGARAMHYNRLAAATVLGNLAMLVHGIVSGWFALDGVDLGVLSNLVLANLTLAVLIRQQHVINGLFWMATRIPTTGGRRDHLQPLQRSQLH